MVPERDAIDRQLQAIFASQDFAQAPKMRALLRYLVEATLAGDAERLKGYAIGVDVFERGASFDPATDPIVRVQAGRLRKLLHAYYTAAGQTDPFRIEIPKGSYGVDFLAGPGNDAGAVASDSADEEPSEPPPADGGKVRNPWERLLRQPVAVLAALGALLLLVLLGAHLLQSDTTSPPQTAAVSPHAGAITLAVLPFTNMSNDPSRSSFADGLTDALTTALARIKSIALASRTSAFQYRDTANLRRIGEELGVRYILEGGLQHDGERMRLNVQLVDAVTEAHLWAQEYDRPAKDELAVQSELVATLAAEIRPQIFSAARRSMEGQPPTTAWQLYIQSTWMPGEARNSLAWEKERVALATQALAMVPELGQAHSVLADKLAYLANVDPLSDTDEARRAAAEHARRALELAPADADVMFNISIHYWHAGLMQESLEATRRTLELDPNHVLARFLIKAVPYTCAVAPQAVIDDLMAFDAAMSPDNPVRWLTLYWIGRLYLNNGDFEKAVDAARRADQIFRSPDSFYQLAAILVRRGETEAALAQINQQRENWPNLDPRHYAEVAVMRRCGASPQAPFVRQVYADLADAVEAARAR
jgi:TolB-like protein